MVAPAIFRVLIDLVLSFSPVLAAFPPPKTCLLIKDELSNWFNHRQNRYNQLKEEKIGVQTKILCTIICFYLFDWFLKYVTI